MAIEVMIHSEQANGLRTKSVRALLRQETNYRLVEVVLPADTDAAAAVSSRAGALWQTGAVVDVTWWLAARERSFKAYYYAIIRAVEGVRMAGGTLDMALAAGLEAVNANSVKRAEFDQWRSMAQLGAESIVDTKDKRDLLVAILSFANAGLIGGARI